MEGDNSRIGFVAEASVFERYAAAAQNREEALCCPTQYDPKLLEVIPDEVLQKDYGCGNPTGYVQPGETVVDLGSGAGKLCFIAAQLVGPAGHVIGIDANPHMLAVARRNAPIVAERLGYANVTFRCGLIQNLRLDLELLEERLSRQPIRNSSDYLRLRQWEEELAAQQPLLADASVDCVLSNCVLNLVRHSDRPQLFAEIFRVLRPGGRVAISDIVSDRNVPPSLQADPQLWSGCISGAFREDRFLDAFTNAGFVGAYIAQRQSEPWKIVDGIAFRSVTIVAHKPTATRGQRAATVIYRGPFRAVEDDLGQRFERGRPADVDTQTWELIQRSMCREMFSCNEPATNGTFPKAQVGQGPAADPLEKKPSCCRPDGSCC
ncbi:MAG: methyltransferase [Pirellulaceae bacterium]|nr:MAG: methyltransferase [Pirellulaceae bacterium]